VVGASILILAANYIITEFSSADERLEWIKSPCANVRKAFGPKQVLNGVDLDVPRGQSLVIIGGSGSASRC
jgi:predicted ABC-type transport system involved in lysophospholipase L1 biosynthesis ATPase subunit